MFPKIILENLDWCFKEPVTESSKGFIDAVKNRYKEVFNEDFNGRTLISQSALKRLDVRYSYGVQRPDYNWDDIFVTIRIENNNKYLTYADILWNIHKLVYNHLHDQDHCFLEGLVLTEEEIDAGIPLYDLILGS